MSGKWELRSGNNWRCDIQWTYVYRSSTASWTRWWRLPSISAGTCPSLSR